MAPIAPQNESFLDRPFARASLRDHLRMEDVREVREEPFHAAVREFLGADDGEMADQRSTRPPYDVPQINFALEQCLADWRLVKQGGDWHSYRRPWTPITYRVEIAPGEFRNVVREGTWFYETPASCRRVISLEKFSHETDYDLTVLFPKCDAAIAREELAPLYTWIDEKHYLKGQTLRAGGKLLEKSRDASWDDVALSQSARRTIQDNVRQFLALGAVFAKNGVPHRRGLLVYGPPGNGKTLIGRVLAATEPATFLYLTAADAENLAVLREAFALARRLKPTIVFLEDLDLYASDRRGSSDCRTLGEILAQLDGLSDNDGLMVIATTNDLTAIEPAIRERPSRFDVLVEVGPPKAAARRKIIERRLAKIHPLPAELLDEAVARTDGYSGAQVQEAALRIIQQAIFNGSLDAEGLARPTRADVEAALPLNSPVVRRRVGFAEPRVRFEKSQPDGLRASKP